MRTIMPSNWVPLRASNSAMAASGVRATAKGRWVPGAPLKPSFGLSGKSTSLPARARLFGFELAAENVHDHAVKLGAAQGFQFRHGGFRGACDSEGALRDHGDVGVRHVQDARPQRDLLTAQAP